MLVVVFQYGNKSLALFVVLSFWDQIFFVYLVLLEELLNIFRASFALVEKLYEAELDFA